mgnify:CR=1 FL=1
MRKVIIMFALAMGIITANAQENVTVETTNGSEQPTLTKEVYPQKEADGDLYHGAVTQADLRPHDTAARSGSDLRQDRPRHFSGGGALCRFRLARPDCRESRRSGERHPREGYREKFSQRNEYVRHHGGRQFLHLQREVRRRTAVTQRGDVRFHP